MLPIRANETMISASIKSYNIAPEELYLRTLGVIGELGYSVVEMQSKGGMILFNARAMEFLGLVYKSQSGAYLKIVPTNSDFTKNPEVKEQIFDALKGFENAAN